MHNAKISPLSSRLRRTARSVNQEEVLAAIAELSIRYRAPSTSLITWRLAEGGTVTASFQAGVRDALQHLRAGGRVACVMHRGTHRWSLTADEPAALAAGRPDSLPALR